MNNLILLLGVGAIGYYVYNQLQNADAQLTDQTTIQPDVLTSLENALNFTSTDTPISSVPSASGSAFDTTSPISYGFSDLSSGFTFSAPSTPDQQTNSSTPDSTQSSASLLTDNETVTTADKIQNWFSDAFSAVGNFIIPSAYGAELSGDPLSIAKANLVQVEGNKNYAYIDSQGILTGGIGHKITASDGYTLNQAIPQNVVDAWFSSDTSKAYSAALSQSSELGRSGDANFVAALISVNFQLGVNWKNKFANTYNLLKKGNWQQAIQNLYKSAWYSQTPARVQQFASAIQSSYTGVG